MLNENPNITNEIDTDSEMLKQKILSLEKRIAELEKSESRLKKRVVFFKKILDLLPQLIFAKNKKGEILYANQSTWETFGLSSKEIKDANIQELIKNKDQQQLLRTAEDKLENSPQSKILPRLKIPQKDNTEKTYSALIKTHNEGFDSNENTVYIADDISAYIKTRQDLKHTNKTLKNILESSPDGIIINNQKGIITECNKEALTLLNFKSKKEILGKYFIDMVIEECKRKAKLNEKILLYKGTLRNVEITVQKKDGTTILVELSSNKIFDSQGNPTGSITIFKDISSRKKTEIALKESERRFKELVNHSPNGILYANMEGQILVVNPELLKIFGSPLEETTRQINLLTYSPLIKAGISDNFLKCLETGEIVKSDCKFKSGRSKKLHIMYCFVPVKNIRNKITGVLASFNDNTQQVQDHEELVKAVTAIENSGMAITTINLKNELTFVNKAAVKLWGYRNEEDMMKLSKLNTLWSKESTIKIKDIWKNVLLNGTYYSYNEFKSIKNNNTLFPLELRAALITDNNSKPMGMTITWNDISEQEQAKQELIKAKEKAEESDRLKSAFLANMSHEIRTPMNGIIGFSSLLKNPKLGNETKDKYINLINSNGETLVTLIDDIIDMAKIEAGQLKMMNSTCDLNDIFRDLHVLFDKTHKKYKRSSVKLSYNLPEKNHTITTDPFRVKQVLTNLVNNAIKFTNEGYIKYGYYVNRKNMLEFFVADTGIGLPDSKKEHIFKRFMQLDDSPTREFGGTGLGLTVSKNLVNLLGGEIWVESELGKGSTFFFTIPYNKVKTSVSENNKNEQNKQNMDFNWRNVTILVAEDEDDNYVLIEEVLKETKANIIRAKDGLEALDIFKNQQVDIVLLDIKMPNKSGYEVVKEMKEINSAVPVIAQTAYAMAGEKNKILKSGCDDYISKPIEVDTFIEMINGYIDK